jgi:hypothetical protein
MVKEYNETVEYIHLNPQRRGLVGDTRDWKWSSVHEYARVSGQESVSRRTACVPTGCACQPIRTPASEGRTADLENQVCATRYPRQERPAPDEIKGCPHAWADPPRPSPQGRRSHC